MPPLARKEQTKPPEQRKTKTENHDTGQQPGSSVTTKEEEEERNIPQYIITYCFCLIQTNKQVLGKLGMKKQLLREIKFRQVKYFGHIKRHDTMIKHLLEGKVEGRRARGRPRDKWEGNFKKWTGYSLAVCNTKAKDRGCWRFIAANLRCGDGT